MRLLLVLTTTFIRCVSVAGGAERHEETPNYPVYRLLASPGIDGDVRGDPAWRTVPGVTGFRVLGGGYAVAKQSTARIGWTDSVLYIAMDCEEPDIDLIDDKGKDGGALWLDNGVEMFIQLPRSSEILQFIVNTAGQRIMGAGRDKMGLSGWQAAALKGEGRWSMEAAIPFAALGVTPSSGAEWRGAVCRNSWQYKSGGDKFTTWPALKHCFREPESFAVLEFRNDLLSPEAAAQIALKLNTRYRQRLTQQMRALAQTGRQYAMSIAEAAGQRAFADEARELSTIWKRVESTSDDPSSVPLPEVRELITMASDLERRSYGIKYRFLIERLLVE